MQVTWAHKTASNITHSSGSHVRWPAEGQQKTSRLSLCMASPVPFTTWFKCTNQATCPGMCLDSFPPTTRASESRVWGVVSPGAQLGRQDTGISQGGDLDPARQ